MYAFLNHTKKKKSEHFGWKNDILRILRKFLLNFAVNKDRFHKKVYEKILLKKLQSKRDFNFKSMLNT